MMWKKKCEIVYNLCKVMIYMSPISTKPVDCLRTETEKMPNRQNESLRIDLAYLVLNNFLNTIYKYFEIVETPKG